MTSKRVRVNSPRISIPPPTNQALAVPVHHKPHTSPTTKQATTSPLPTTMHHNNNHSSSNSKPLMHEIPNMLLLIVLYTIQGVPNGLAFGSIPFLIQQHTSYTQLGIFSFASYPYSLKLLWSPIIDTLFIRSFGRRKSWIIPIQFIAGILLLYISQHATEIFFSADHHLNIQYVTGLFFVLVFLMASQDVAVDGWSLELLHKSNIGYASTCQTIGLSIGYFVSYTIFLALNSPEFCNSYLRSTPQSVGIVSLSGYLRFWGIVYLIVTVLLALFKHEEEIEHAHHLSVSSVYKQMLSIIKLPNMRKYIFIMLTCKLGFVVADAVTPLKLVEKGFRKDNLAVIVTIAFPFEFLFAILAGKWARGDQPLLPWKFGFITRSIIAILGMGLVYYFPSDGQVSFFYYLVILGVFLLYSLSSNFMFVSQGGFFARIADPRIGGTYMTLLNTVSNFGGTYPRFFVFYFIDLFTRKGCASRINPSLINQDRVNCAVCNADNEKCVTTFDGYYIMGAVLALVGIAIFIAYSSRTLNKLQRAKESSWLVSLSAKELGQETA